MWIREEGWSTNVDKYFFYVFGSIWPISTKTEETNLKIPTVISFKNIIKILNVHKIHQCG